MDLDRIELIQDFGFNTATLGLKYTPDGKHIVATGLYPPAIRVFEVEEMSMKFERALEAEVINFEV